MTDFASIGNSTDPLVNEPDEEQVEAYNQVPQEIEDFMAEHGLMDSKYTCYVKRYPPEGGGEPVHLPWQHKSKYPTAEELGSDFGPGKYLILFTWRTKDENNKSIKVTKEFKMILGEEWEEIAMEKASERMLARNRRLEKLQDKEALRKTLRGENGKAPEREDGVESLRKHATVLRELGVPIGGSNLPAGTNQEGMGMLFQAILAMQQKSSEVTMNMMMENSKQQNAMMIALMQNNKPQTHNDAFKEVMNMVTNMADMKAILSPEKKTALDRLFDTLEGSVPMLLQMTAEKRAQAVAPLQHFPQTAEIKDSPEQKQYMVEKLDKKHGPENTDVILGTLGWTADGLQRFPKEGEAVPTAEDIAEDEAIQNEQPLTQEVIEDDQE